MRNLSPSLLTGGGWGVGILLLSSCARMGSPDGGWYDERPPQVVSATPADRGTGVDRQKVTITFDEFIRIENATEKVVVSPPQLEMPEVKAHGRNIIVELKDSLKANTTYTIDFSDAISDNNEGNPMGHYTYSFSTGDHIDTLEVSGTVLNASNLEPIKGILVGLYQDGDTVMRRVSRTDSRGQFVIRGIAPGEYTVGALKDMDGDFRFSQRGETMAFSHDRISPSSFTDIRQDTIWLDELHVKDILRVKYTHFMPDNIILRAFDHEQTDRYFLKAERKDPESFTLFYTAPLDTPHVSMLPEVRLLDAPATHGAAAPSPYGEGWAVIEPSHRGDTITYWLRDTALVNKDTLTVEVKTLITDSLGILQPQTDTLQVLSKVTYAKRMKDKQRQDEEWQKKVEKQRKKYEKAVAARQREGLKPGDPEYEDGLPTLDTIPPVEHLKPKYKVDASMSPDGTIYIDFPTPLARLDTAAVHLYVEQDSLWYRAPFTFEEVRGENRRWQLYTDWIMGAQYSFEVDTLAFQDIYGRTSEPLKAGLRVKPLSDYSSLFVNITAPSFTPDGATPDSLLAPSTMPKPQVVVELIDGSDKAKRKVMVTVDPSGGQLTGTAEFYYVEPGEYYLRAFLDRNGNGTWDTGDYYLNRQPEEVFYYNEKVECKAKWDITKTWNLTYRPLDQQKPSALIKQKADKEKTVRNRNAERALQKGVEVPERFKKF